MPAGGRAHRVQPLRQCRRELTPVDEAGRVPGEGSGSSRRGVRFATVLGVSEAGRVLQDFATYLPTQALPAIAAAIALPVLARRLFPTDIGVLAIAQNLITLGWTFAGSWLAIAIIRELPAH